MSEKYGFVYLWYDRKHKRYYIGCRWGREDDGYVCSSVWMKQGYKHRPTDFKRRILTRVYSDKKDLLEEEHKWLSKIKSEELGKKYYNLHNHHFGHWSTDPNSVLTAKEKMKANHWSRNPEHKDTVSKIISEKNKGKVPPNKGVPLTDEQRQELSRRTKGTKKPPRTQEHRDKIAENNRRLQAEGKIGMTGKTHSNETKQKMSDNNAMNNSINIQKVRNAKKNIRWLVNSEGIKKMAQPNTSKWDNLIETGFKPMGAN